MRFYFSPTELLSQERFAAAVETFPRGQLRLSAYVRGAIGLIALPAALFFAFQLLSAAWLLGIGERTVAHVLSASSHEVRGAKGRRHYDTTVHYAFIDRNGTAISANTVIRYEHPHTITSGEALAVAFDARNSSSNILVAKADAERAHLLLHTLLFLFVAVIELAFLWRYVEWTRTTVTRTTAAHATRPAPKLEALPRRSLR